MHHLLDTSIIVELNKFNLLEKFLSAFDISRTDIYILKEIVHKLSSNAPGWDGKKPFSEKLLKRCTAFCDGLTVIKSPYLDIGERDALQKKHHNIRVDGKSVKIDEGEAQLFAFSAQVADFRIYTADRKALMALTEWPGCDTIRTRLAGRVICLERVLRQIAAKHGFSKLPVALKECHDPVGAAVKAGEVHCPTILKTAENRLQVILKGFLAG